MCADHWLVCACDPSWQPRGLARASGQGQCRDCLHFMEHDPPSQARPGPIPHTSQLTSPAPGISSTLFVWLLFYERLQWVDIKARQNGNRKTLFSFLDTLASPPPLTLTDTYITWSVTGREPALPLRQKSVSRTNYTKLCNNWPRNRGSLLAAPSMSAKKKLPGPWLMAVMQMTSRFMRTDQLFYVQGSG